MRLNFFQNIPVFRLLLSALILMSMIGCSLINTIGDALTGYQPEEELPSLEEALAVTPLDSRPDVLNEMGPPDSFEIHFDELEGQTVRWESWSYYDFGTRFDFIDGELLWTAELDPIRDGAIYAHFYDPGTFQANMSPSQVKSILDDQVLEEFDLEDLDLPGGLALAGDQILLGFQDDRLIFVETLVLEPDPNGQPLVFDTPARSLDQDTDSDRDPDPDQDQDPEAGGEPEQAGGTLGVILEDDFNSNPLLAEPIFDDAMMELVSLDGEGSLTTKVDQSLAVAYYPGLIWDDFILKVDITMPNTTPGTKAGVVFRSDDPQAGMDSYYYIAVAPEEESIVFGVFHDSEWKVWEYQELPPELVPGTSPFRLRIDCIDNLINVRLNGIVAAKFQNSQISGPGYLGLSVATYQAPETAIFSYLRIESISEQ